MSAPESSETSSERTANLRTAPDPIEVAAIAAYSHFMLTVRAATVPAHLQRSPIYQPHWDTESEELRTMWRGAMKDALAAVASLSTTTE